MMSIAHMQAHKGAKYRLIINTYDASCNNNNTVFVLILNCMCSPGIPVEHKPHEYITLAKIQSVVHMCSLYIDNVIKWYAMTNWSKNSS